MVQVEKGWLPPVLAPTGARDWTWISGPYTWTLLSAGRHSYHWVILARAVQYFWYIGNIQLRSRVLEETRIHMFVLELKVIKIWTGNQNSLKRSLLCKSWEVQAKDGSSAIQAEPEKQCPSIPLEILLNHLHSLTLLSLYSQGKTSQTPTKFFFKLNQENVL